MKRILLIQTKNKQSILKHVLEISKKYFIQKSFLQILVKDEQSGRFIDDFLWKEPKEGFLPHELSNSASIEPIVITEKMTPVNNALTVLNLTSEVISDPHFQTIYEYALLATPRIQKEKIQGYKSQGHQIIERNV